ncbi:LysR family transcriptional regulator [Streptomyces sodiiphilus]|uniref:LysR family transcriptional regulator n=1 Tax=Streptomyces sodiiphilus TaxID=226217 RepID=UPI0031D81B36
MNVELRHANIVAVIGRAGSISKAAVELNLPQSSLTAQLRRIERAVGGRLFSRTPKGVVPTSLGEHLIPMFAELVEQADQVIAEAASYASDTFRFGNAEWTPPSLHSAVQKALPYREVQTETLHPVAAVEAVLGGVLDAAMVPSMEQVALVDVPEFALSKATIVSEPVWVALPKGHPLVQNPGMETAHLGSLPWVRYSQEHWFRPIERHIFAQFSRSALEVLHYVDSHHEAMSWVRDAGAAALTTPVGATRDVRLVPLSGSARIELLLVWRRDSVPRDTQSRLVETIRRYYGEYARSIPRYWSWIVEHPEEFPELSPLAPASFSMDGHGLCRPGPQGVPGRQQAGCKRHRADEAGDHEVDRHRAVR